MRIKNAINIICFFSIMLVLSSCIKVENNYEDNLGSKVTENPEKIGPHFKTKRFKKKAEKRYLNFLETKKIEFDFDRLKERYPDLESVTIISPGRGSISLSPYELDTKGFNWYLPDENGEYSLIVKEKNLKHVHRVKAY